MRSIFAVIILLGFTLSSFSQTTYVWTGAVNSNFSTAGNWAPVRQIGRITDVLVFDNGSTLNIINVNQVTVGQLLVMNNTQLKLSPSSGNPKVISIEGDGDMHDFISPSGPLEVSDVKYNEYMNSGNSDSQTDVPTQKYKEYEFSEKNPEPNDLATQKYDEYKNPPTMGMGDKKVADIQDDPYTDNDLTIEAGSSITVNGTDPNLSIYIKHNASAAVYGSLIFTGESAHTINSFDTYSIIFKEGSSLVQSSPGHAFSNTGINNAVVFEKGSSFQVNHTGALDPFAMSEPSSKVKFERGSNIVFNISNSVALRMNGRNYSNLIVGNNCNIDVQENFASNIDIDNIIINTGATLSINNLTSASQPSLNLKGDILVNGTLRFQQNENNKINLNFIGDTIQSISGSGIIDFNTGIKTLYISNDIKLNCDIAAMCPVVHHDGNINTNGHTFSIYNTFVSAEVLPVGVIIIDPLSLIDGNNSASNKNRGENKTAGIEANIPAEYSIAQNYPNPFNPATVIDFKTPINGQVSLKVYDIQGREIAKLTEGNRTAGNHSVVYDGTGNASGVYFYRIIASGGGKNFTRTLKMVQTK